MAISGPVFDMKPSFFNLLSKEVKIKKACVWMPQEDRLSDRIGIRPLCKVEQRLHAFPGPGVITRENVHSSESAKQHMLG